MSAVSYADHRTLAQTGLEIAQEMERLEKLAERRNRVRRLLHGVSDPLLDRAERANYRDDERISRHLKADVRRLEAQVFENVAAGPDTPQEAVERVLRAQETLLTWLYPKDSHADAAPTQEVSA